MFPYLYRMTISRLSLCNTGYNAGYVDYGLPLY
jgi:hypothetical protein